MRFKALHVLYNWSCREESCHPAYTLKSFPGGLNPEQDVTMLGPGFNTAYRS